MLPGTGAVGTGTLAGLAAGPFGTHDLALFVAAGLLLNALPGPDLLLTLARTWQRGPRAGAAVVLGVNAGCTVHALAGAFGLAALLAAAAGLFDLIKYAGAAWLLWLAWGMARTALAPARPADPGSDAPTAPAVEAQSPPAGALRGEALRGFLTNVLNPKVVLFFVALLPQFIGPVAAASPQGFATAFLFLAAVFIVDNALLMLAVVLLAAALQRRLLARWRSAGAGGATALARALRVLHGAGAALFLLLAWRLARAEIGR